MASHTNNSATFAGFDPRRVPSPCFVVDTAALEHNLELLHRVQEESGAKVLLALKAFSMFHFAPLIQAYLSGTCASGLHEARLGHEEFGGEVHTFSAAYDETELREVLQFSKHVVFNSFGQWQRFRPLVRQAQQRRPELSVGLRINPEHSEGAVPLYDPCAPCSRLGIPRAAFDGQDLSGVAGLHFHTLCEQGFAPLARTLEVIEAKFAAILPQMQWINFGGGHHITKPGYDVEGLIARVREFSARHGVQVYLEPGEAVAIHTGVLVAEVLDLGHNQMDLAILDASATCHMPDTLEMPYRAAVFGAGQPGDAGRPHVYRLGGPSCLAGDVMGDYAFAQPLEVGQRLMFDDMAHYTMVKTTTFNGIRLPALAAWDSRTDAVQVVREFGYEDFRDRLS
jgi:carboxynorspermidine decarboxylase